MTQTLDLSVIIPSYNKAATIAAVIERIRRMPALQALSMQILVVDDVFSEETAATAQTEREWSFNTPMILVTALT